MMVLKISVRNWDANWWRFPRYVTLSHNLYTPLKHCNELIISTLMVTLESLEYKCIIFYHLKINPVAVGFRFVGCLQAGHHVQEDCGEELGNIISKVVSEPIKAY